MLLRVPRDWYLEKWHLILIKISRRSSCFPSFEDPSDTLLLLNSSTLCLLCIPSSLVYRFLVATQRVCTYEWISEWSNKRINIFKWYRSRHPCTVIDPRTRFTAYTYVVGFSVVVEAVVRSCHVPATSRLINTFLPRENRPDVLSRAPRAVKTWYTQISLYDWERRTPRLISHLVVRGNA